MSEVSPPPKPITEITGGKVVYKTTFQDGQLTQMPGFIYKVPRKSDRGSYTESYDVDGTGKVTIRYFNALGEEFNPQHQHTLSGDILGHTAELTEDEKGNPLLEFTFDPESERNLLKMR